MPLRQIPLIGPLGIHQDDDDAGTNVTTTSDYRYFINGYFEKNDGEERSRQWAYVKRPGLHTQWATGFTSGHNIQGIAGSIDRTSAVAFSNNGAANKTWYITFGSVTDRGAAPAAAGNWTNSGAVVITPLDGISYGANVYYAATDFTKGAVIASDGTWTEITDAVFTGLSKTTNLKGMNGYLYVGTANNRIYNSDLNAATTWTSTSFLSANDVPGRLLWLERIRNFLIVFKDNSIEFFEDVGAPTPGSPLEARKSMNSRIGLLHRNTIQEVSDGIIFAGITASGVAKIYKINKHNLEIVPISNRYVEQNLAMLKVIASTSEYSVCSRTSNTFAGESQSFSLLGKEFYTINLNNWDTSKQKFTLVYDNTLGIWTAWGSHLSASAVLDSFGFGGSQAVSLATGTVMHPVFVDNTPTAPRLLAIDPSTNIKHYDLDDDGSTQNEVMFGWTSDQFDFGSRKRKFMDSCEVHYTGDSSETPNTAASTSLTLLYRDFDYNTTAGYVVSRTLYYDIGGGVRCRALRLGNFRKRSFTIRLTSSLPFVIWAIEVQYNEGETDQEG